ncbi:S-layer homology domain-containing protein [Fortiea contorta]|uniref:S-layer homology domain-containing protein n=1 Tax=Fortiea contorta TaxID=1892405 RepID=UPI00034B8674|nr:S-layer homology domain-containing protein [Fortiea contorta]
MTNTPPPDPESSSTTALGFDEFIAILVALATIGTILFWSFSRRDAGGNFSLFPSPSPVSSPSTQLNPASTVLPTVEPNAGSNLNTIPADEPEVTPITPPTTTQEVNPAVVAPLTNTDTIDSPAELAPLPPLPPVDSTIQKPLSLVTPTKNKSTFPPPIAFDDVPKDFWGQRFINVLSARNIIKGFPDYSFRPNQPVSRAEFAAILQQAFDKKLPKNAIAFKDIEPKFWATPAINHAISTGFLKGYPDSTFKPDQKIQRVQVLVALVTGLNLKASAPSNQALNIYKDAKDIPKYAADKIAIATANNLVVNYPDLKVFAPTKEATRAEVAAMIHQALVKTGQLDPISSQNIVRLSP